MKVEKYWDGYKYIRVYTEDFKKVLDELRNLLKGWLPPKAVDTVMKDLEEKMPWQIVLFYSAGHDDEEIAKQRFDEIIREYHLKRRIPDKIALFKVIDWIKIKKE